MRETVLAPSQLVLPLFVRAGTGVRDAGVVDAGRVADVGRRAACAMRRAAAEAGVGGVLLFGIPEHKDDEGSSAWDDAGAGAAGGARAQARAAAARRDHRRLHVRVHRRTDTAACCVNGEVDNDATLELLAREALSHARAGADIVAPSDMMDGRVGAIRAALDDAGFTAHVDPELRREVRVGVLRSVPRGGGEHAADRAIVAATRWTPPTSNEALRETWQDIEEGADMVMVKPAGPFLDVIARVKAETGYPLAAYQVSGEYAMIQAAAERGWIDRERAMMESLIGIRRAGADVIITYFARDAAARCACGDTVDG